MGRSYSFINNQRDHHFASSVLAPLLLLCCWLLISMASATTSGAITTISHSDHRHHQLVAINGELESVVEIDYGIISSKRMSRRLLSSEVWWVLRLGSSPPTCRSKCGRCWPCRAVHVPIQPGRMSVPLEYYPEAWRCKCRNKFFMP